MVGASVVRRLSSVVLVLILLLNTFNAWANEIDSCGYGGQIRPVKSSGVRVVRQDLSFVYQRDSTRFRIVDVNDEQVILNDGAARRVEFDIVYPKSPLPDPSHTIEVNGKVVTVSKKKQADSASRIYHFTVKLVKGRNTIRHQFAKESDETIFHDIVIGYQMRGSVDTFNLSVDAGRIGEQKLLMMPASVSSSPSNTTTIIDTICVRDLWPDRSVTMGVPRCPGDEVAVMICPDGKIRYTGLGFGAEKSLLIVVANEMWLRTKAMRSAVPPPLPGQLHGMPR